MVRHLAILALSFGMAACSASGPAFRKVPVTAGKGVIYAYRPDAFTGRVRSPTVQCGDSGVDLKPGGYHPFIVAPGTVTCTSTTGVMATLEVPVKAGEQVFVKEKISYIGKTYLFLMDRFSAEREITECKLQP